MSLIFFNVTSLGLRPRRGGQPCVGARVTAVVDGYRLVCILAARTSYLSTSDSRFFIALGAANRAERLEICRPSGASQEWIDVGADRFLEAREGSATVRPLAVSGNRNH